MLQAVSPVDMPQIAAHQCHEFRNVQADRDVRAGFSMLCKIIQALLLSNQKSDRDAFQLIWNSSLHFFEQALSFGVKTPWSVTWSCEMDHHLIFSQ